MHGCRSLNTHETRIAGTVRACVPGTVVARGADDIWACKQCYAMSAARERGVDSFETFCRDRGELLVARCLLLRCCLLLARACSIVYTTRRTAARCSLLALTGSQLAYYARTCWTYVIDVPNLLHVQDRPHNLPALLTCQCMYFLYTVLVERVAASPGVFPAAAAAICLRVCQLGINEPNLH